jgi:membrane associated rhomboid family serine protease
VGVGIAMLLGWKPAFATPTITPSKERSLRAMFIFGIAYAVASIGCTIGFLTTAIFGSIGRDGFLSGVLSLVLYGLGMSLLVTTLTISLAAAQSGLVAFLKRGLPYMDRIAAVFLVLTGVYLSWYWFVAITERNSLGSIGSNVEKWQSTVANFLQRQGAWRLLVIFLIIVTAAAAVVWRNQKRLATAPTE